MKKRTITAIFDTHVAANQAMDKLIAAGFTNQQISMVATPETQRRYYSDTSASASVSMGAGVGAIIGGLTAVVTTPVGFAIAGPLLAVVAGTAVGAVGGGLLGALVELGMPEEQAQIFLKEIETGRILLAVECETEERAALARSILRQSSSPRHDIVAAAA